MFSYHLPSEVIAGKDALLQLPKLMNGRKNAVLFTDRGILSTGLANRVIDQLREAGVTVNVLSDLPSEPTCDQAQDVIAQCRALHVEQIIAMGGGSVMDVAKLASVTPENLTVRDLLENSTLAHKTIPCIMIPTTAGTGAEATPNAIVAVPEKELKVGIVSPEMIPEAVILDGETIRRLPKAIAASTGIDALCHAIECYTSKKATPFSDLFAMEALRLIFANIEAACCDPDAEEAKVSMLMAAFYGGAAIACSGTTAVHALSYPLGGKYHIPHGISNAIMLMPVMRFNLPECTAHFARVADAIGYAGDADSAGKAQWLLERMESIVQTLEIPRDLGGFGVRKDDLEQLVESGMQVQRLLVNNLREVTREDACALYLEVLPE